VLGAGFYVIVSDLLSSIWPRWLLLLGGLLIVVALFMQKGLWGLLERLVEALPMGRKSSINSSIEPPIQPESEGRGI
jgi:branched-chain amino acid transport system permease protein